MYAAFAIAAIIGVAIFLIWWITSDVRRFGFGGAAARDDRCNPAPVDAPIETALPRGGTLTGSTGATELAMQSLTGATLLRVNRGTDEVEPGSRNRGRPDPGNLHTR